MAEIDARIPGSIDYGPLNQITQNNTPEKQLNRQYAMRSMAREETQAQENAANKRKLADAVKGINWDDPDAIAKVGAQVMPIDSKAGTSLMEHSQDLRTKKTQQAKNEADAQKTTEETHVKKIQDITAATDEISNVVKQTHQYLTNHIKSKDVTNPSYAQVIRQAQTDLGLNLNQMKDKYRDNPDVMKILDPMNPNFSNADEFSDRMGRFEKFREDLHNAANQVLSPEVEAQKARMAGEQEAARDAAKSSGPEKSKWETKEITGDDGKPALARINANTGEVRLIDVKPKQNATTGRQAIVNQRLLNAGNETAMDLANIAKLPTTSSSGIFGSGSAGPGLLDAGKNALANKLTTQEVQSYKAMATGLQRNLAAMETSGLAAPGSLTHQMEAVMFQEGDTNMTKLTKLAQTRQIVEAVMEISASDENSSPDRRKKAQDIVDKVRKAIPYSVEDVIKLQQAQEKNPKTTMKDIMPKAAKSGEPAKTAPPEALQHLKDNPELKDAFQKKYGYLPDGM